MRGLVLAACLATATKGDSFSDLMSDIIAHPPRKNPESILPKINIVGPNPLKVEPMTVSAEFAEHVPEQTGVSETDMYQDPGADCSDELPYDNNLNGDIAIGGKVVDLQKAGTYKVKYFCAPYAKVAKTAKLAHTEMVSATRTVIVDPKYNPSCQTLKLEGNPSKVETALGEYSLLSQKHDGRVIYKQLGHGTNHIYYYEDTATSTFEWRVEQLTLKQIRSIRGKMGHGLWAKHTGLMVASSAIEPQLIEDTWRTWSSALNKWGLAPSVKLSCVKRPALKPAYITIKDTLTVTGLEEKTFTPVKQYRLALSLANELDVPLQDVAILQATDVKNLYNTGKKSKSTTKERPFYEQPGIDVVFQVKTLDLDIEEDIKTKLKEERFETELYDEVRQNGLGVTAVLLDRNQLHVQESKSMAMRNLLVALMSFIGLMLMAVGLETSSKLSPSSGRELQVGRPFQAVAQEDNTDNDTEV